MWNISSISLLISLHLFDLQIRNLCVLVNVKSVLNSITFCRQVTRGNVHLQQSSNMTHRIHVYTYIHHKHQPNLGKNTTHGSYGYCMMPLVRTWDGKGSAETFDLG